ncbi:DEAD/DEAH box helicase [Enterobacter hormaechei]
MNVVALYGGQRYDVQLMCITPRATSCCGYTGLLLDHLNRGTLDLSKLKGLVLDEADEMLRMGFIEDVENILVDSSIAPDALFSAMMPEGICCIARRFMNDPKEVCISKQCNYTPRY